MIAEKFQDKAKCEFFLRLLSLISNEYRFKILCLLSDGEHCVADIAALVGGRSSNISQQLKTLSLAGYVRGRRQGKMVYYGLKDERIQRLLRFLNSLWKEER